MWLAENQPLDLTVLFSFALNGQGAVIPELLYGMCASEPPGYMYAPKRVFYTLQLDFRLCTSQFALFGKYQYLALIPNVLKYI